MFGGVDHVHDLEAARARLALDVVGAVDQERQMVQERRLTLLGTTLAHDELLARDAESVAGTLEAELLEPRHGRLADRYPEDDVVEVGHVGLLVARRDRVRDPHPSRR